MKSFFAFLVVATMSLFSFAEKASAYDPAGCTLQFNVRIRNTVIFQSGGGTGYLVCRDFYGRTSRSPVRIRISGFGPGIGYFNFKGISANLGFLEAHEIFGRYHVVDAHIAAGLGGGLSFGLYNQRNGLSLDLSGRAGLGFGVGLTGSNWTIY